MSRPSSRPSGRTEQPEAPAPPLIFLIDRAYRALQADMLRTARERVFPQAKYAHNAVFSTLFEEGARTVDMAERAGMTRQSMGEVVRDLVGLGVLEMRPDPDDRRAKLVTYTDYGLEVTRAGFQHLTDLEKRFAEELGEEELAAARELLEGLVDLLDRISSGDE